MKNTNKLFGIALVAIITFTMAGCSKSSGSSGASAPVAPSGTYGLTALESWTITFGQGTFTMVVPAQVAPGGVETTASGNFTVQGNTVTLTGLAQPMTFTITNATTLTEPDGSVWKTTAASASGAKVTLSLANNSDFPVNVAVYSAANISGGQVGDFLDIKPVYEGQSGTFSLDAGSYGIIVARDAQTVWMYPQGGSSPGLISMSGNVNLRFTGKEILSQ